MFERSLFQAAAQCGARSVHFFGIPLILACFALQVLSVTAVAQEETSPTPPRRIYLDEFLPKPMLKTPQHPIPRAKFPVVNVHTHPIDPADERVAAMFAGMDDGNVAVSVTLSGPAGGKFADYIHGLEHLAPDRIVGFVWIDYVGHGRKDDPSSWDVHQPGYGLRMADQLSEAVKVGACGLKVWKDLGLYMRDLDGKLMMPDDPRFDPIWTRCGELGIPVVWHCADPMAFFLPVDRFNERIEELNRHPDWSFYGQDFPSHQELIDSRNRVIAKHPETTFICAHMSDLCEDLEQLGGYLDQYPNMNVEIAARVGELGREPYSAGKFFIKYADRILFGTDGIPNHDDLMPHFRFLETWDEYFPYRNREVPPQGRWSAYGIGLPEDVLRKVYNENAGRLIPGVAEKVSKYQASRSEQPDKGR